MAVQKLGLERANLYAAELKKVAELGFLNEPQNYDFVTNQLALTPMPADITDFEMPARIPYEITHLKTEKGRMDYEISLRRLIDPRKMNYCPETELESLESAFLRGGLRIFHSEGLMRKIRGDLALISLIKLSKEPSALFRVEFQDDIHFCEGEGFDDSKKPFYVVTLPVLVIPRRTENEHVANFARDNAFYEKGWKTSREPTSKNLASRFKVRISAQEYHKATAYRD